MSILYKNDIKRILPLLQEMEEGKTLQIKTRNGWIDVDADKDGVNIDYLLNDRITVRIKQEPKYRQFKDAEECFEEMKKHQPFGWIKDKQTMKQEVFQERMDALSVKLREVENEMRELQEEYIANYPIQPGDKCINENDTQCWLSRIVFANIYSTHPNFLVNYPKMDGTRSKQEQYVYGKLTKVE